MTAFDHDSIRQLILNTFATRFTCKRYDPDEHISDEDFACLLDVARRSPSSFGLEPWKFLVIEDKNLLADVLSTAWGAKKNADRTVIILARKRVDAASPYTAHMMRDVQGSSEEDMPKRLAVFKNFQENDLHAADSDRTLFDWASKQTYIPLANMLTAAAMLGIDSTPVEGYNAQKLDALLGERGIMDADEFGVSLIVQFGRHAESHFEPHQTRQAEDAVIERV